MYVALLRLYNDFKKIYIVPNVALIRLYYYHWGGLPYFFLFTLIKFVVWTFQSIWWRMNGVKNFVDKINRGELYEQSTHVLTVLNSCKPSAFEKVRDRWHYLTVHHSFQHPDYVLRDDVMLIDVTYTKAVFVQLPKSLSCYTVKTTPFLFITLVTDAVKLIEMPLASFHRLAEGVGDPTCTYDRITFLFNIGRSGSTVVARIVEEADPETVVLSEPPVLYEFVNYMRYSSPEFAETALRNALRLLLKPMFGKRRVVVKPTHFVTKIARNIRKTLPTARMYFCYRDSLRVIWAQERAFGRSPLYRLLQFALFSRLWVHVIKYSGLYRVGGFYEHGLNTCLKPTLFDTCTMSWAYIFTLYREQAEEFEFPTIYYDKLFDNPYQFCREILKSFSIPESRLSAAMNALNRDAQEGTLLSQNVLRYVSVTPFSWELKERIDRYCDCLNLPRLNWDAYQKHKATAYTKTNVLNKFEKISSANNMIKPLPMQCVLSSGD